jgi:hypothetical protein
VAHSSSSRGREIAGLPCSLHASWLEQLYQVWKLVAGSNSAPSSFIIPGAAQSDTSGWFLAPARQSCDAACVNREPCHASSLNAVSTTARLEFVVAQVAGGALNCSTIALRDLDTAPSFLLGECIGILEGSSSACNADSSGQRICCCSESGCPVTASTTPAATTQTQSECGIDSQRFDLVLVLDSSASLGLDNWNNVKQFAAAVVAGLAIGPDATRYVPMHYLFLKQF